MNINTNELSLQDLTLAEIQSIVGGSDSIAKDVGEAVGYFLGFAYTGGLNLIEKLL
jgi:hypothetical protein